MQKGNTDLALSRLSRSVRDQNIARVDASCPQLVAYDAHGIEAGAAKVEKGGQIDDRLNVILCGALEARRLVALIASHFENITRTPRLAP